MEKSRFIATVCRASTSAQANALIKAVAKEYAGATHHCYAYRTADGQKYTDAGEPQGTAGLPIFNALTKQGLFNVVVVVTRYFGGIKLGTGGLARAYGRAASDALTRAPKVRLRQCALFTVTGDYAQAAAIENTAQAYGQVLGKNYQTAVEYQIAVPMDDADLFVQKLADALRCQPNLVRLPDQLVEVAE